MVDSDAVVSTEMEKVLPNLPTLFDNDDLFYAAIEKRNVESISDRDMRIPLAIRPGGNFGQYDSDGGDLGTGGGPDFQKAVINTIDIKEGIQWTKKAEWGTDDSRKAIINTFRKLLAGAMPEFRRNVDSLCMQSGNGVLGTVTTVTPSGGVDTVTCTTDGFGVRLLRFGMFINIYDTTLATRRTTGQGVQITYIDPNTATVKWASVTGCVATDKIVVSGVSGANPVSIYGVPYHQSSASTGTWLGFNRADYPEIRANSVTASGSFALPFARLAQNMIGNRLGMNQVKSLQAWMHPCQQQAYEELGQLVSIIQKQAKQEGLDMYFDVQQLCGATIKKSYSWDKTRIDFIDPTTWGRAELKSMAFYEVDGRRIFELRGESGGVAASQVFYVVVSFNLFNMNPAAGAYISALTVPNGYY